MSRTTARPPGTLIPVETLEPYIRAERGRLDKLQDPTTIRFSAEQETFIHTLTTEQSTTAEVVRALVEYARRSLEPKAQ